MPRETLAVPEYRRIRYLRDQRLRELGYSDYNEYVGSPCWAATRRRFYDADPNVCCHICRAGDGTFVLHHKTYERVGAERLDDLVALCPDCHSLVHALQRRDYIGLDFAGLIDVVRGAQNRRQLRAQALEREAEKVRDAEAFNARLLSMEPEARIAVAQRAADAQRVDIKREVWMVRAVVATGRTTQIARRLDTLEFKAHGIDRFG